MVSVVVVLALLIAGARQFAVGWRHKVGILRSGLIVRHGSARSGVLALPQPDVVLDVVVHLTVSLLLEGCQLLCGNVFVHLVVVEARLVEEVQRIAQRSDDIRVARVDIVEQVDGRQRHSAAEGAVMAANGRHGRGRG